MHGSGIHQFMSPLFFSPVQTTVSTNACHASVTIVQLILLRVQSDLPAVLDPRRPSRQLSPICSLAMHVIFIRADPSAQGRAWLAGQFQSACNIQRIRTRSKKTRLLVINRTPQPMSSQPVIVALGDYDSGPHGTLIDGGNGVPA